MVKLYEVDVFGIPHFPKGAAATFEIYPQDTAKSLSKISGQ
jgi:hypothetical protein